MRWPKITPLLFQMFGWMTGRRSPSPMTFDQWYIVLALDHTPLDRTDYSVANAESPAILLGAPRNAEWHQSYIENR